MSSGLVTLAELCNRDIERFAGATWPSSSLVYIDVSAVDASSKLISEPRTIPVETAPSRAQSIVREGDILVSTVRPNLNAVARVPRRLNGAVCSSAFAVLRPLYPEHGDLLFCYVQSPRFITGLMNAAQGSHYPAVNDSAVFAAQVNSSQWKDAQIGAQLKDALNTARQAVTGIDAQVRLADQLLASQLQSEFAAGPPISAGGRLSDLSEWQDIELTSLARLESGHTPSRRHPEWWGGQVPWLALPDIRKLHGKVAQATTENTNDAGLRNSSARLLPVDTVCVSRTASVGFVSMLGRPMATSQDFCNWICDPERLDPEFLMYAFMASQDYLRELGSGAVHKSIYMPTIKSFHICAPAIGEQRRIARTLRDQLAAAEALQNRLAERRSDIERLPQRILAAAFGDAD